VQSAVDNRTVDAHLLFWIAGGRVFCAAAEHILASASTKVTNALDARARQFYSGHIFRSMARLDVPTWDDPAVSSLINSLRANYGEPIAWSAITTVMMAATAFLRMFCEVVVLFRVLQEHGDGSFLVLASLASEAVSYFAFTGGLNFGRCTRNTYFSFPQN